MCSWTHLQSVVARAACVFTRWVTSCFRVADVVTGFEHLVDLVVIVLAQLSRGTLPRGTNGRFDQAHTHTLTCHICFIQGTPLVGFGLPFCDF